MLASWAVRSMPRMAVWTASLMLVMSIYCCAHADEPSLEITASESLFSQACSSYRQSQWQTASEKFARYLQQTSQGEHRTLAQLYRAESLAQEQRWAEVRLQLEELLQHEQTRDERLPEENQRQIEFRIAESFFFTQQLPEAQQRLARFVSRNPHDRRAGVARLYMAEAAIAQSDFAESLKQTKAIMVESEEASTVLAAKILSAKALGAMNQAEGAIATYESIIGTASLEPSTRDNCLLAMSRLQEGLGHRGEAKQLLSQLIAQEDRTPEAAMSGLYELALLQKENNEVRDAQATFEKLIADFPGSPYELDAKYRIALLLTQEQKWDEALALLPADSNAQASTELKLRVTLLLAEIHGQKKDWASAAKVLDPLFAQVLPLPEKNAAEYWRAEAAFQLGDHAKALDLLESLDLRLACSEPRSSSKALDAKTQKFYASVVVRRAQTLTQQKQYAAAQELLGPFFTHYAQSAVASQAYLLHAQLQMHDGKFELARESLRQILRSPADLDASANAQWLLAESLRLEKRYDEALMQFAKVSKASDFPHLQASALLQTGLCHEALHQPGQALTAYQQVTTRFAKSPTYRQAQDRLSTVQLEMARKERRTKQIY
ncbi:MAG: tetratricopeptide repeat protein [Pirellulales bacterium]